MQTDMCVRVYACGTGSMEMVRSKIQFSPGTLLHTYPNDNDNGDDAYEDYTIHRDIWSRTMKFYWYSRHIPLIWHWYLISYMSRCDPAPRVMLQCQSNCSFACSQFSIVILWIHTQTYECARSRRRTSRWKWRYTWRSCICHQYKIISGMPASAVPAL